MGLYAFLDFLILSVDFYGIDLSRLCSTLEYNCIILGKSRRWVFLMLTCNADKMSQSQNRDMTRRLVNMARQLVHHTPMRRTPLVGMEEPLGIAI